MTDPRIRAVLRERFDKFAGYAFRRLNPATPLVAEPYLEAFWYALQQAGTQHGSRLLVTMPPRHLKSFSAAICMPAWLLGRDPSLQIGVVTYGQRLEKEHTDNFRKIIESDWYRAVFPNFRLADRGDRADRLLTEEGGGYKPLTISGAFTGRGVDVLILDDMQKAQEVESPTMREAVEHFYRGTALTRFNDQRTGRIIAAMHRMHLEDIVEVLLQSGRFRHLDLPSTCRRDITLPLYSGREWKWRAGDLLSPDRYPRAVLDNLRKEIGAQTYEAQYEQNPMPAASMLVDFSRINLVDAPFPRDSLRTVVQSVDTAVKDHEGCDYSVITTWGFNGRQWCLMHVLRDRLEYPALKAAIIGGAQAWNASIVLVEDSHTGAAFCQEWRQMPRGDVTVRLIMPEGDKAQRLAVAVDTLYSEQVVLPKNEPWFAELRKEFVAFPGKHDDMVDSTTQFLTWLKSRGAQAWVANEVLGTPRRRRR